MAIVDIINEVYREFAAWDADNPLPNGDPASERQHIPRKNEIRELLKLFATTDSPTFTGSPRGPTPSSGAADTLIATAAWVRDRIAEAVLAGGGGELSNFTPAGMGAVARTIRADLRDMPVSVKRFDAKGDDSTNDRDEIAAVFAGEQNVWLPPGTYVVDGDPIELLPGHRIRGPGKLVKKTTSGTLEPFFLLDGVSDIDIDGVQWLFAQAGAAAYGLYMLDSTDVRIRNVRFGDPSNLWGGSGPLFIGSGCHRWSVLDSQFFGGNGGVATGGDPHNGNGSPASVGVGAALTSRGIVHGCYFEGARAEGFDGNWDSGRFIVSFNRFHNCATSGTNEAIDIGGGTAFGHQEIIVVGNVISYDAGAGNGGGIVIKASPTADKTSIVICTGNSIRSVDTPGAGKRSGLSLGGIQRGVVAGNIIDGFGLGLVATGNNSGVLITGNDSRRNSLRDFTLQTGGTGNPSDILISANKFGDGASPTSVASVRISDATNVQFVGNTINAPAGVDAVYVDDTCVDIDIDGNRVQGGYRGVAAESAATRVQIRRNHVSGSMRHGILGPTTAGSAIDDNTVEDWSNSGNGLYYAIEYGSSNGSCFGNRLSDTRSSGKTAGRGINIAAGLTGVRFGAHQITGLEVTNVPVNGIANLGAGSVIVPSVGFDHVGRPATVATDADFTLTPFSSAERQFHTGTLTAHRAVTLSTTNAVAGLKFRITRTGAGAFNLNVGTGPLKALAVNTWCEVEYTGSAWALTAYGAL